jgi:hypothetical protein
MSALTALYSAWSYPLPAAARVAYLFCLLGLALTAAFAPVVPSLDLGWVLANIE